MPVANKLDRMQKPATNSKYENVSEWISSEPRFSFWGRGEGEPSWQILSIKWLELSTRDKRVSGILDISLNKTIVHPLTNGCDARGYSNIIIVSWYLVRLSPSISGWTAGERMWCLQVHLLGITPWGYVSPHQPYSFVEKGSWAIGFIC